MKHFVSWCFKARSHWQHHGRLAAQPVAVDMPNSPLLNSLGTRHAAVFKQGVGMGWKTPIIPLHPGGAQVAPKQLSSALHLPCQIDQSNFERKRRCQGGELGSYHVRKFGFLLVLWTCWNKSNTLKHATCRQATLQVPAAVPRPNKSALIRRQGRNFPLRSWPSTSKCYHPTCNKIRQSHPLVTYITLLEAMCLATKIRKFKAQKTQRIYAKDFICTFFPGLFFGSPKFFFLGGWGGGFSKKNPQWRKITGKSASVDLGYWWHWQSYAQVGHRTEDVLLRLTLVKDGCTRVFPVSNVTGRKENQILWYTDTPFKTEHMLF